MDRMILFVYIPTLIILIGFANKIYELPETGFWAMEGTLVTHYFEDKTDSLSGPELFELQDENGLPFGLAATFLKMFAYRENAK